MVCYGAALASLEKDEAWQQAEALLLQMRSDSWWHILNKGEGWEKCFFFWERNLSNIMQCLSTLFFGGAIDQIIQGLQPQGFSSQIPLSMFPSYSFHWSHCFFWGRGPVETAYVNCTPKKQAPCGQFTKSLLHVLFWLRN